MDTRRLTSRMVSLQSYDSCLFTLAFSKQITNNNCHTNSLQVIKKLNFEKPTPIQAQAIPAIMAGRDVIGVAKTGSGKTVAFLLPMFRHIKDQRPLEPMEGPVAIIMTPTRELAVQIHRECKHFLKALALRVSR